MSNMFDYAVWRGCIGMARAPFAAPDALVLCAAAAALAKGRAGQTVKDVYKTVDVADADTARLLSLMASAPRFSALEIVDAVRLQKEEFALFGGVALAMPQRQLFIAFFDAAHAHEALPPDAIGEAAAWLDKIVEKSGCRRVIVGGIDRGGEAALAVAGRLAHHTVARLSRIFDFDAYGMHKAPQGAVRAKIERYSPIPATGANVVTVRQGRPAFDVFSWEVGATKLLAAPLDFSTNANGYLTWFGDVTVGNMPIGAVDALLLSKLVYSSFDALPTEPTLKPCRLRDIVTADKHAGFATAMAATKRFGGLRFFAASSIYDRARAVQFAGLAVLLPANKLLILFRGTDGTLAGWHEDFRMSYDYPVPAQEHAVQYVKAVSAAFPMRRLILAGHSKGGNLAMYAAVHCGTAFRERIEAVYNFDGPGFADATLYSPRYLEIRPRLQVFVPQHSVVGMLLEHDNDYRTVKSDAAGVWMQHDITTWQVRGLDFVSSLRSERAQKLNDYFDFVLDNISPSLKRQFIETVFSLLADKGMQRVADLKGGKKDLLRLYNEFKRKNPVLFERIFSVLLLGLDAIDTPQSNA